MKSMRFIKIFITTLAACIIAVGLFAFLLDPFYHYHAPIWGTKTYLYNAVYQTPGAAKNLTYDSVITGTSMTENFDGNWFDDELGWNTLKLSYSGARTNDLSAILGEIYESQNKVKHIVMDMDDYQLRENSTTAYVERPSYLYDSNPFNDVNYLFNTDVLIAAEGRVLDTFFHKESNMKTAYIWHDNATYSAQAVMDACRNVKGMLLAENHATPVESDYYVENAMDNVANITPYMEEHPETEFIIYFPPYSMLFWERSILRNDLRAQLTMYDSVIGKLLSYENVRVFYFHDDEDEIYNLGNYRDEVHYSGTTNRRMFECFVNGEHEVTLKTYKEHLENMREIAEKYDYDAIWVTDQN